MPRNSGHTKRDMFGSHPGQNGKGSADRSPGWREHYDEIDWGPEHIPHPASGQVRRFRKTYGGATTPPAPNNYDEIFRKTDGQS